METEKKKKERKINVTIIIMFLFAGILTFLAYQKSPGVALEGLKSGGRLFWDILPSMILGFIAAGMIMKVLPRELMTYWLGEESGMRGLIVATFGGALTPGGPFIQFPIIAALLKAGAGVAPLMAYITSWSLLGISRFLIYEIPIMGWKLAVSRIAVGLVFPIIIGLLTKFVYVRM